MGLETGKLERSVDAITIGAAKSMSNARVQREIEGLLEYEEQFVIEVEGSAEEFPVWSQVDLLFGTLFLSGRGNRDSDLIRPHFVYGSYVPVGGPIGLLACVTKWNINKRDEAVGCTLGIGAVSTDLGRKFRGELHARFQGFGMPVDSYSDLDTLGG